MDNFGFNSFFKEAKIILGWDAGVVERGGLENRCPEKIGTGGSNPPPTAILRFRLFEKVLPRSRGVYPAHCKMGDLGSAKATIL